MRVFCREPARDFEGCELRLGVASWDDGSLSQQSVKFTWFKTTKKGTRKAMRGGEMPVGALPQALSFAIRRGYLDLGSVDSDPGPGT